MAIDIRLVNGEHPNAAGITSYDAVKVSEYLPDLPKIGEQNRQRYLTEVLGSGGASVGVTNMNVDGSVTPQEFFIRSAVDYDIHINKVTILISDNTIANNKFGAINALTNGFDIKIKESGLESFLIEKAITTGEMSLLSFGTFTDLANWDAANNNARIIVMDITQSIPQGLRLGRGTKDTVTAVVNDDLTGLVDFNVYVTGYRFYE